MKAKRIYSEEVESLEDMSKDRIILDLSWNEFMKLQKILDASIWGIKREKVAESFRKSLKNATENQEVEWR